MRASTALCMAGVALFIGIAVGSCDRHPTASDGYYFEGKQFTRSSLMVEVVTYPTSDALRAAAASAGARQIDGSEIVAWSRYKPGGKVCQINMIDPAVAYQPEFDGHELLHCVFGQFHPSQD